MHIEKSNTTSRLTGLVFFEGLCFKTFIAFSKIYLPPMQLALLTGGLQRRVNRYNRSYQTVK